MPSLQKLVAAYERWAAARELPSHTPVVEVDRVAAKVAAFYEKIRGVVDWSEEHLLRKTAIARILRRRLLFRENGQPPAEAFVRDLVRGGYFPNGKIPQAKIPSVAAVLEKYLFLMESLSLADKNEERRIRDWLILIASAEVEALLDPPIREEALMEAMTEAMMQRIAVKRPIPEKERENLIFVAVRQALFKLDEPIISFHLIKKYVAGWDTLRAAEDRATLEQFARDLPRWYESIRGTFRHSFAEKFYWVCEGIDTPFLILGDILDDLTAQGQLSPERFSDERWLEAFAATKYKKRLARQKKRALRAAVYSTISIFLTKVLVAYAIEVPFDRYVTKEFDPSTMLLNIIIPPVLMLMIVLWGTRPPSKENAVKVMQRLKEALAGRLPPYEIKVPEEKPFPIRAAVWLLYFAGSIATFTLVVSALSRLHFSLFSQGVFIFFVSLIAFAGARIRERAKELVVEPAPPTFLADVVSFFTLPVVELGRWASRQLLRIKVLQVLLDVVIELPLQFFVEFIEQWRTFLKEKKEEIH